MWVCIPSVCIYVILCMYECIYVNMCKYVCVYLIISVCNTKCKLIYFSLHYVHMHTYNFECRGLITNKYDYLYKNLLMHILMYMYVSIHIYVCLYVFLCAYVCMYVRMCTYICSSLYACKYTWVCTCESMCVCFIV